MQQAKAGSKSKETQRIAKAISRSGICSRRDAEKLIAEGRVQVNGTVIDSPALNVSPEDRIAIDGEKLPQAETARLFMLHKPRGILTTASDPEGRRTIYDMLPKDLPRLMPVGRLDFNSEGLLLLTNDGELKRRLEHPSLGWKRRYRVRVFGTPSPRTIAELARGVTIEGVAYRPAVVAIDTAEKSNAWITVTLTEGKNREIRKLMEHYGHPVSRLLRTAFGPFQLGALEPGQVKEVPAKVLHEQLGS